MAETRSPIIKIQTLEAVRNVKELKDNITALKKAIDSVDTSTEDYADLTKQLSQNQAALRNVMNGTNSTFQESITAAQGLDSSYNSLVQQLKEATQEWRAIPKYLTEVDAQQNKVNQAWSDASSKVLLLRTQLKSMDEGTGSYVRNVGNYKSALEGFSGAMGAVKQVGGDMVNGLSAAASTLSLMGLETDGLNDSMKNLKVVLAAVQGAKGFAGLIQNLVGYFKAGKNAAAATKAQTTALEAETAAQNTANAATNAGTVALGGLQKALIATGIGALVVGLGMLVSHFEDIVKWLGKVGEKFGLWKAKTDTLSEANEKLNEKMEEQNRAFELKAKLLKAQGKSQKVILTDKLKLIDAYIKEKNVIIQTAEARLKEIEGHNWLQRVLKGENRERKKLIEDLKVYKKELDELKNEREETSVDIRVEGINEANKAAEDAKKKADQALETARKILDKQIDAAKKLQPELKQIESKHKENVKDLNDALEAIEKITGATAEQKAQWKEILEGGLANETKRYTNELSSYYKNEYEKKTAEEAEKITREKNAQYMAAEKQERLEKDILGLNARSAEIIKTASVVQRKEYEILKQQVELIKNDIEPEIFSEFIESGKIFNMTDRQISEMFVEPTATAIRSYISKSNELTLLGEDIQKNILEGYEDAIQEAISSGKFDLAQYLRRRQQEQVLDLFGFNDITELLSKPGGGIIAEYLDKIGGTIREARLKYNIPEGGLIYSLIWGPDRNFDLRDELNDVRRQLNSLGEVTKENAEEFEVLNEKAAKLSMQIWDNYFANIGKHFQTYGMAISNLMGSVADAWEAALQAQVKNGKKSEEEAKKSFEAVKALQIGVAVINTAASVTSALADPTVPSYFVKAANAVAALAAGTAQVIKISQTEFSANAAASTENTPTLVDRTPQLQYTVALNTEDYAAAMAERPIRAYVVDKDLSDGLDQYNRRRGETTF